MSEEFPLIVPNSDVCTYLEMPENSLFVEEEVSIPLSIAILDQDNILRAVKHVDMVDYVTDNDRKTVALPSDHDVEGMIDQYFYNYTTQSFLPILHLPQQGATLKSVGYDLNIVDALVMAVCDMIDGRKPALPALLYSSIKARREELAKRLTGGSE